MGMMGAHGGWLRSIAYAIALALLAPAASGAPRLYGVSFADGVLYDVDATTGAATNPRPIEAPWCPDVCETVAVGWIGGIEIDPASPGELALVTTVVNEEHPSTLMRASLADPEVAGDAIAALGAQIGEGDLALDPVSGDLFAIGLTNQNPPFRLLRIDPFDVVTDLGVIGVSDVSGLAFDAAGTLYALETGSDRLLVLDPSDASTLSSVDLSLPLGGVAGMDFDLATGVLWVADGGDSNPGQDTLFTLDVETGVLTEIGPLGLELGLSALAVPEPEGAALAAWLACAALAAARLR